MSETGPETTATKVERVKGILAELQEATRAIEDDATAMYGLINSIDGWLHQTEKDLRAREYAKREG
ncbi:MAG: hypothetical protein UV64_C0006G0031 [Parcubacteria group bacterium GW2011_GWC1_43_11b]|uniref:Uncharacterized protein n=2 Tax=Candidatus Vogeliibacteriota TaxID=1817922 RepID=A0A1G2QEE0_9BACT|nr:MAG: hypothetical protein UV50_C0004G0043 [Parcubacteria group bacterium GW2011_GWB1_42_9]KKS89451.1 MAG: hypothetical protein UV64_C0006G0031 [Parcubacteria group bacterium GW2011_GWC1_43_11b]KKT10038.1 MAG: hypothetical protein UV88_C0003G0040 [Parcubacteria group bacterium GW2011_GWA1_43_21]OHA58001.1 MAG: hypothetical protein A2607_00880 [Candidatus Vogelbacteria bacterium RIFOXYD1_FULL_42_15]OHA58342.1 MAG: hypothetical protein A2370_01320 [Candidatus Vogelbacteria bacterium RIFOXYB1_FU